jgi:hypothetical protein
LLKKAEIRAAIDGRTKLQLSGPIASREERQAWWTKVMKDEDAGMYDRLRASELLGKSDADFVDRHELTGKDGGDLVVRVITYGDNDA